MRALPDAICITLPPVATMHDVEMALQKYGETLLQRQKSLNNSCLGNKLPIITENFVFRLQQAEVAKFQLKRNGKEYILLCPEQQNRVADVQPEWLRKVITNAMVHRAKEILPGRLQQLAIKYSFKYSHVTIRVVRTRWGSCSSNGAISLNAQLVLLPSELIDYVLLHELCHTIHMNHGAGFWSLLDACTDNKAKLLREQLHGYKISV